MQHDHSAPAGAQERPMDAESLCALLDNGSLAVDEDGATMDLELFHKTLDMVAPVFAAQDREPHGEGLVEHLRRERLEAAASYLRDARLPDLASACEEAARALAAGAQQGDDVT